MVTVCPLAAGSNGLQYFTLRNGWDPGARYMEFADNRAALRATARHHREATGDSMSTEDGLCAQHHVLAPREQVTGPEPSTGAGQFWLVLSGNLLCEGRELPVRSCVFVDPNEPPLTAIAGATGLRVLTVQYPRR